MAACAYVPSSAHTHGCLRAAPRATALLMAALPERVAEVLPSSVLADEAVVPLWRALRAVYPSEEAAVAAARRNSAVLMPYMNTPEKIRGSWGVVQELCGDDALDIITRNPGVLGCDPDALAQANADQVRSAANVANVFETVLGPARRFLQSLPGWDETR
uniref:Uncharacterized protein n=1 Tax=Coccolithus braarudii TaxID=221442 RepID=A0A7S0LN90_9EUKA